MPHLVNTKPFYILNNVPTALGFQYCASPIGTELICDPRYVLQEYDTEDELAVAVDALVGEDGWYYKCSNRIPYPPNPNEWNPVDCADEEP